MEESIRRGILVSQRQSRDISRAAPNELPSRKTTFTIQLTTTPNAPRETYTSHGSNSRIKLNPKARENDIVIEYISPDNTIFWDIDGSSTSIQKDDKNTTVPINKKRKRHRITVESLLDPDHGFTPVVANKFPYITQFKGGSSYLFHDLQILINAYREWILELHPKINFRRAIRTIEQFSTHRRVLQQLNLLRDQQYSNLCEKLPSNNFVSNSIDQVLDRWRKSSSRSDDVKR